MLSANHTIVPPHLQGKWLRRVARFKLGESVGEWAVKRHKLVNSFIDARIRYRIISVVYQINTPSFVVCTKNTRSVPCIFGMLRGYEPACPERLKISRQKLQSLPISPPSRTPPSCIFLQAECEGLVVLAIDTHNITLLKKVMTNMMLTFRSSMEDTH
jgi:hypothetical protein